MTGPLLDRLVAGLDAVARAAPRDAPPPATARFGMAVSGGADSLALLLLSHALRPGHVEAATVDHGLRAESAAEARFVAELCAARGIPHAILHPSPADQAERQGAPSPAGGVQAMARRWRYRALAAWCAARRLDWLLTAHHADDQAETLLMRLARGAGPAGLAGIRRTATIEGCRVARPLLDIRKSDLVAFVAQEGIAAVEDPSNRATRFDRTRARALLAANPWIDARRLGASASHCGQAEAALDWSAARLWEERARRDGDTLRLDPHGVPPALLRRLVERAIHATGSGADHPPPGFDGPELARFIARLEAGGGATLAHVQARGGAVWRFGIAPPRRTR